MGKNSFSIKSIGITVSMFLMFFTESQCPAAFASDVSMAKSIVSKNPEGNAMILKPALKVASYVVCGKVTEQNGTAGVGLAVKASDRNPGVGDRLLGQAMTNSDGNYMIPYTFAPIENKKTEPDLVISVYEGATQLMISDVIFSARPSETRDLVIPTRTRLEFQHPGTAVKPLSRGGQNIQ
jgi:hypothetical protein